MTRFFPTAAQAVYSQRKLRQVTKEILDIVRNLVVVSILMAAAKTTENPVIIVFALLAATVLSAYCVSFILQGAAALLHFDSSQPDVSTTFVVCVAFLTAVMLGGGYWLLVSVMDALMATLGLKQ
jgi:hypothetical protein